MKDFIKLETCLLDDPGVALLRKDLGDSGIGVYISLRLLAEEYGDGGVPREYLLGNKRIAARKSKRIRVLDDYDLFSEDEDGNVHPAVLSPGRAVSAPRHATPTDASPAHGTPAHEPTKKENRKEKIYTQGFKENYPTLAKMKSPLTLEEYHKLLARGFSNEKIISKLQRMDNLPDVTKKYSSVYKTLLNWLKR